MSRIFAILALCPKLNASSESCCKSTLKGHLHGFRGDFAGTGPLAEGVGKVSLD